MNFSYLWWSNIQELSRSSSPRGENDTEEYEERHEQALHPLTLKMAENQSVKEPERAVHFQKDGSVRHYRC